MALWVKREMCKRGSYTPVGGDNNKDDIHTSIRQMLTSEFIVSPLVSLKNMKKNEKN